jgi:uncharacterized membrane protein
MAMPDPKNRIHYEAGSWAMSFRGIIGLMLGLATLAYPFAVYLAIDRFPPGWIMAPFVLLAFARCWITRSPVWLAVAAGALILGLLSQLRGDFLPMKLYPILVNVVMLCAFGFSLMGPITAIERIARLRQPDLPPAVVAYTRKVTQVWCVFFLFNGAMSLATALWTTHEVWVFYNGFLAYVLMGMLFAVEWMVRQRVQSRAAREAGAGGTCA